MMYKRWRFFNFLLGITWLFATATYADVSVNVPIGHWSYRAIDKLATFGLILGDMRGTRPWTRLEMAGLILEAQPRLEVMLLDDKEKGTKGHLKIIEGILDRLQEEFRSEIDALSFRGTQTPVSVKPLEDLYTHFLYGDKAFNIENNRGQKYTEGLNVRAGFSTHGDLFNHFGYSLNPEYRFSNNGFGGDKHDLEIQEGYGKLEFFNMELEAGRDSLWWGTGRHGSLILTDNAQPFDLIKLSNPRAVVLPWIFRYLGLFKFVAFWTELEKERAVPEAELLGFRIHVKPSASFEIGASRAFMLGGENSGIAGMADLSFSDWRTLLFKGNAKGRLNTNQIAGLDGVLRVADVDRWLPLLRSMELWSEWYGEDEAGGLPSKGGWVVGLKLGDVFLTGRTDVLFEYADNAIPGEPGLWYRHGIYRTGYTYRGEVIGHNMGSDARDYYARLEYYLSPDLILGLDYNRQERGVEAAIEEETDRLNMDLRYHRTHTLLLRAAYRYESIDNLGQVEGVNQTNHIFRVFVHYSF